MLVHDFETFKKLVDTLSNILFFEQYHKPEDWDKIVERIQKEFMGILSCENPAAGLGFMRYAGLFEIVCPERVARTRVKSVSKNKISSGAVRPYVSTMKKTSIAAPIVLHSPTDILATSGYRCIFR